MRNPDALLAMHRTAYYLKVIQHYHLDLVHDTEAVIGRFSSYLPDEFGWVIYDSGTHILNPNLFKPGDRNIDGTFIHHTFGRKDGEMFMFWWDGDRLIEVTPEQMDALMLYKYESIMLDDQRYQAALNTQDYVDAEYYYSSDTLPRLQDYLGV